MRAAKCYQATRYVSEKLIIRATKPRLKHRKSQWQAKDTRSEFVLTIGQPNYREREFIRACKKAGEPLPVRKIQLRDFPK